ncbi:MAG TPA: ABC transporter permease [Terriglobales bacterium]|nr:ABC transporter permease [Terriglobales bacterium]
MTTLSEDIRYGLRMLCQAPGFALIVVLTLALGIGANTALFSVVNGVLLHPLPYPEPEQLVRLHESKPSFETGSISYPNFRDWQKENKTFSAMAISRGNSFALSGVGEAEQVNAELISSDFFSLLGVKPVVGRVFAPGEDEIGAAPVAIISVSLWERKFSSSSSILGKGITLDGKDYTVVGVMPSNFDLLLRSSSRSFQPSEVYVPIGQWGNPALLNRGAGLGLHGVGRLRPGIKVEQAQADMDRVTRNLAVAYPDSDRGISAKLVPLKAEVVAGIQPILLVLLGAVGFVLLIACVNVANLLLARSTMRMREFAIRAALGASQGRVVRQLLTESMMIALAGGGLGLLLAAWGTRTALALLPAALPRAQEIGLDIRVLVFTTAISVIAGVLFGMVPALRTSRQDLHGTLKEGSRSVSGVHHRTQNAFVVVEMAMALVLLTGAGLMIRSLVRLWSVSPGFDSHNVLTFNVSLPPSTAQASPDAIRAAWRQFDDKVKATSAIESVSLSWGAFPLNGDDEALFWIEGQPKPSSEHDKSWAVKYVVEPDYLRTMGIQLQRGRFLNAQDNEHAPPVVVVDDAFASKYFPNQNPIGKRLYLDVFDPDAAEIVGIVGHVKQWGLDRDDAEAVQAQVYLSFMQLGDPIMKLTAPGAGVVVRSTGSAPTLFDSLRHASAQMSSQQVVYGPESMDEIISGSLAARRFSMILLSVFAGLALLLASVGIYGVISYVVGERTREMGIRMALGAQRSDILWLILRQGGTLAGAGVVLGLISSMGLARFMTGLVYGVGATDPVTFLAVAMLLGLVALAACCIPALRAAKVDPMVALRYE